MAAGPWGAVVRPGGAYEPLDIGAVDGAAVVEGTDVEGAAGPAVPADTAGFWIPSFSRMVLKMLMAIPFWILSKYGKMVNVGHLNQRRGLYPL